MHKYFALLLGILAMCLLLSFSSCNRPQPVLQSSRSSKSIVNTSNKRSKAYRKNDSVSCALVADDGSMWFGTNNEGIYRYDGENFTHFTEEDGLCSNVIDDIMQDDSGKIWVGTPKGLCSYDNSVFDFVTLPFVDTSSLWLDKVYPTVNPNGVRSLLQDQSGNFWIATNGAGAYKYNGKTFTSYLSEEERLQEDSLHHNVLSSVLEDKDGNICFTSMTHGGVSRYGGEVFSNFKISNGLQDDMIFSSLEDSKGNIWFGSLGNREGGLHKFDGNRFTNFNESNGLCNNNVICIFEDQVGNIWTGSQRGELCILMVRTLLLS